jgi:hypothetical protein
VPQPFNAVFRPARASNRRTAGIQRTGHGGRFNVFCFYPRIKCLAWLCWSFHALNLILSPDANSIILSILL